MLRESRKKKFKGYFSLLICLFVGGLYTFPLSSSSGKQSSAVDHVRSFLINNRIFIDVSVSGVTGILSVYFLYSCARLFNSKATAESVSDFLITNPHLITFNDVAGLQDIKTELFDIVDALQNPTYYNRLGARLVHGILFTGDPGNGKTLLAQALAGEAGCTFLCVSGSEFEEQFVGVGAARIRALFNYAREHAPAIIFIDEIDAVGGKRTEFMQSSVNQTLNQLLVEMDGFSKELYDPLKPVIVIAATNRPDSLDPALLRSGRFDYTVCIPRPDADGREEILAVHTRKKLLALDVDLRMLAMQTNGMTGADLENLVNRAALLATRAQKLFIEPSDFQQALSDLRNLVEAQQHSTPTTVSNKSNMFQTIGRWIDALCTGTIVQE